MIDIFVFVCAAIVCASCFIELHAMSTNSPSSYLVGFALCGCAAFGFAMNALLPPAMDTNPEIIQCVMLVGLALIGLSSRRSPWRLLWQKSKEWDGFNRRRADEESRPPPLAQKVETDFMKGDHL